MPKLSIITVNLNNAKGLQKTIESVVNQTFTDLEYIIIDGGSKDGSKEIIEKYADKITYWVSEPDKGIYNGMNKGIKVAKGEYCQFLNSGDWLIDDKILEQVFVDFPDKDVVYGNIMVDNNNLVKPYSKITLRKLMDSYIPHPASFIKKTIFLNSGFYDEKYKIAADWDFFLKNIILNNYNYKHIDIVIANFQSGGISSSIKTEDEKIKILEELFPNIYQDYIKMKKTEIELQVYKRSRIIRFIKKIQDSKLYKRIKSSK